MASGLPRGLSGAASVVVGLHALAGLGLVWYAMNDGAAPPSAAGSGLWTAAYVLGLRHAFDADHIAAIDNAAQQLVRAGRSPTSAGLLFSLGHSSVVLALCGAVVVGLGSAVHIVGPGAEEVREALGAAGTLLSAGLLVLLAVLNAHSMRATLSLRRRLTTETSVGPEVEAALGRRGLVTHWVARTGASLWKPWHQFGVGVMFGVSFDTAGEVGLLVLAGTASGRSSVPWPAVMSLPLAFAAGMSLLDTADGVIMAHAYRWASGLARRADVSLIVTALCVAVALGVAGFEIVGLAERPPGGQAGLDSAYLGLGITGMLILGWATAAAILARGRRHAERP